MPPIEAKKSSVARGASREIHISRKYQRGTLDRSISSTTYEIINKTNVMLPKIVQSKKPTWSFHTNTPIYMISSAKNISMVVFVVIALATCISMHSVKLGLIVPLRE